MKDHDLPDCLTDSQEDELLKSLGKIVASSYPNPDRAGCPEDDVLQFVASRKLDPVEQADHIAHIATCSPCFSRVQALQKRTKRRKLIGGVGLAMLILGLSVFKWQDHATPTVYAATIDLRKAPIVRGSDRAPTVVGELPRGRIHLSVILPVGSQAGTYHFALTQGDRAVAGPVTGPWSRNQGVDAAQVTLDTTSLSPGTYQLLVRHEEVGWAGYVVRIR